MGNGLHGTFPLFIHSHVYPPSCRLRLKMGRGNTDTHQLCQCGSQFLRSHIFTRFGTPRALIIDSGTHFRSKLVDKVLKKYGVRHRTSLTYHLQANGQAEVSNHEIKFIMQKRSIAQEKTGRRRSMMHFRHTRQPLRPL